MPVMISPTPSTAAPASTRVELCGPLVAQIGGRRVEHLLPGRKGRQLFTCLVIAAGRPTSRDELIEAIWHADAPNDPDATFATLLTRLRGAVGRDVIRGRNELVLDLGPDAWVDWHGAHASVGIAERLLAAGDARGALAHASEGLEIARRPLLPGLSTPWLEDRRRELVDLTVALLETAGRAALALRGEHLPQAERYGRELIDREPYRESGYALLMEIHESRGNVAEALRVFDDLRTLLREELGLTPAPALSALADRLLKAEPTRACTDSTVPLPSALAAAGARPLGGRQAEFQRLAAAVMGGAAVVAVAGEAGIGKTRLVAELAAHAHGAGFVVLRGRAQRAAAMPFEPLVEALRGYLAHGTAIVDELLPAFAPELAELARLVPALRGPAVEAPDVDGPPHTQRVCEAAAALLAAVARRGRVLLVLEDLQWATGESLLALRRLAGTAQLTVLATLRDDEPHDPSLRALLVDLHRDRALDLLTLGPLDEHAVAALAGVHEVTEDVRVLRAHTCGNPFLIEELVAGAGEPLPFALQDGLDSRLIAPPQRVQRAVDALTRTR
jgi:DNA-binding SARP family transcriptional activator